MSTRPDCMRGFELYLVRHAIADERGPDWPDDSKRPLTEHGISRFKEEVKGLARLDAELDEIFTSPFVRAKQTAQLLASGLRHKAAVRTLKMLEPGHGPAAVIRELAKEARKSRIAIVGHEPDLGDLASHLLGTRKPLPFKKGGICRIDIASLPSARAGTLVWMITPKILRKLAD